MTTKHYLCCCRKFHLLKRAHLSTSVIINVRKSQPDLCTKHCHTLFVHMEKCPKSSIQWTFPFHNIQIIKVLDFRNRGKAAFVSVFMNWSTTTLTLSWVSTGWYKIYHQYSLLRYVLYRHHTSASWHLPDFCQPFLSSPLCKSNTGHYEQKDLWFYGQK